MAPDELTLDKAIELLAAPKSDEPIGFLDGLPVFAKNGRYLAVCMNRNHFLSNWMFGFINVVGDDDGN